MPQFGGLQANMGPFAPVSLKGNAQVTGVPVFVDKLPLTIGGVAGENVHFGRVVSVDPANRRHMVQGVKSGYIVKGISMLDPTIMRLDPGMNDYYFAGRPMTAVMYGIVEIKEYDATQSAPMEGSTVWARNTDGVLAFNDGTDISSSGYTKLNAFVYETLDPNGAKVFFGCSGFTVAQSRETVTAAATPTASPAAGAVASGTEVALASTTAGAKIFYTVDGSAPSDQSTEYTGPIAITAATTIKAIAVAEGYDPSSTLTAAYTIS